MRIEIFIAPVLGIAFGLGLMGGLLLNEHETKADLVELDQWRAAYVYQSMQSTDEVYELPKWCKIVELGNYGYNWEEEK